MAKTNHETALQAGKTPSLHPPPTFPEDSSAGKKKWQDFWDSTTAAAIPSLGACFKTAMSVTVALYILNQKHMLPRPLSAFVSKALFWPSMPITVLRRIGRWETVIDDTVIMGGAPFGFAKLPEKLYETYGVRGVINLCEEYRGPEKSYKRLGMLHLWLPTTDHFEPTVEDLTKAVKFIAEHEDRGKKVYVHCRAGHGRSAAVVFAWLLSKDPDVDLLQLNQEFCQLRDVRKTLWKQRDIIRFHSRLRDGGRGNDDETEQALSDAEL